MSETIVVRINGVERQLTPVQQTQPHPRAPLPTTASGKPVRTPPSSASLRELCPPALCQSPLNACVPHAFTAALRYLHRKEGNDLVLSPLFCHYIARVMIEGKPSNLDDGLRIASVVAAIEGYGVCREELWPYDPEKLAAVPSPEAFADAESRRGLKAIPLQNLRAIKCSIADGFPATLNFDIARSVEDHPDGRRSETYRTGRFPVPSNGLSTQAGGAAGGAASAAGSAASAAGGAASAAGGAASAAGAAASASGFAASASGFAASAAGAAASAAGGAASAEASSEPDLSVGGHAVLVVGYDDASETVTILNSWGPDFGDKGYGTLPYAFFGEHQDVCLQTSNCPCGDAWTIRGYGE
ncbi:MAG: C1 family peptidase [Pseudomonadota bacterium]|nr:C1 family peptidase [Pseudomonadota bacterium]